MSPSVYQLHIEGDKLSDLVDSLQSAGQYVLTREYALAALGVSDEALKKAVQRLVAKRRLAAPRRGASSSSYPWNTAKQGHHHRAGSSTTS